MIKFCAKAIDDLGTTSITITKQAISKSDKLKKYMLFVTNESNDILTDIVVSDSLQDGEVYVPYSTIIGVSEAANIIPKDGITICNLPALSSTSVKYNISRS